MTEANETNIKEKDPNTKIGYSPVKVGKSIRKESAFYRGENANFYPSDETYEQEDIINNYLVKGTVPKRPFINADSSIVAFGSCFAEHLTKFFKARGYNVATKKEGTAYVSSMSAGIVNTFALRQQFEWAWLNKIPQVELWHGYDAKAFGYDEEIRLKTKALFDNADVFIITIGLAEIWYDEPTGEVFWRAVPKEHFDSSRHKFRVSSVEENIENLKVIYGLISKYRPTARIVFILSPIPLLATFRNISCPVASAISKSTMRVAVDAFMETVKDDEEKVFYFPSYEIVLTCFKNPFLEDRRHIHKHVLDFNMNVFERYYCTSNLTDRELCDSLHIAQKLDNRVAQHGHWSVVRILRQRAYTPKRPPFHIRALQRLEFFRSKFARPKRIK